MAIDPANAGGHDCAQRQALAALLDNDDPDAALAAGLMQAGPVAGCPACASAWQTIATAQARFGAAWAARERYRARQQRLQQRAAERQARRLPPPAAAAPPALPPAAAAALARARARAAAKGHGP